MGRIAAKFDISGIEPARDPIWLLSGEGTHRDFWREVVRLVKIAKDRELASGLDRFGKELTPIKESTRRHRRSAMGKAYPEAPPLTPAYDFSRTRAWFDGRAFVDHAEFFWRNDWGRILKLHKVGAGRLPVRDVIGLSLGSLAWVKANAAKWWSGRRRQIAQGVDVEQTTLAVPSRTFPGRQKPPAPPKIEKVGSFDFDRYTFGIGGSENMVRKAAAAGYFTGFRRLGPNRPPRPPRGTTPSVSPKLPPHLRVQRRTAARKGVNGP